jgi:hypothetical protein
MEADNDIAECFAEAPGNHWLAKAVFVAGTSCITPSFPDFGLDKSPPELRLFNYRECASIPMGVNLQDGPGGTRELSSPVDLHLEGLIKHLSMPKSWIDEPVEAPSEDCKRYALEVARRLCATYGIIPYKITVSKEGGVFAAYRNPHNDRTLRIEVDNDLDVAAVVSDGDAILDSGLLEADDLERSLLGCFDPHLARTFSLPRAPGSFSI